jgi:hypothetical protein
MPGLALVAVARVGNDHCRRLRANSREPPLGGRDRRLEPPSRATLAPVTFVGSRAVGRGDELT